MLMNSLIIFNVRITPPGWQLLWGVCARLFRSHRKGACLGFPVNSGIGVTGLPFCPVPQGPNRAAHHVLSVVAALAIPGSGPPPVASLCSSRREQPGARRGQGCGPRAKHRSGWRAGRREGSPPGGRQGWAEQRTLQERTGEHGEKNQCLPKYLQNKNLQIKKIFDAKNKKGGTAFFLPSSSSSLPMPPAPRPPESRRQERALQQDGEEAPTHTTREGAALPPAAAPATTPGPQPKPGPEPPPAGPRRLTEGGVAPRIAPPIARAHVAWVGVRRWNQASALFPLSLFAPPLRGQPQVKQGLRAWGIHGGICPAERMGSPRLRLVETW